MRATCTLGASKQFEERYHNMMPNIHVSRVWNVDCDVSGVSAEWWCIMEALGGTENAAT